MSRASRAGRTGGTWYGSYEVHYQDGGGNGIRYDVTSRKRGERACRNLVDWGATWAELRSSTGEVIYRKERKS